MSDDNRSTLVIAGVTAALALAAGIAIFAGLDSQGPDANEEEAGATAQVAEPEQQAEKPKPKPKPKGARDIPEAPAEVGEYQTTESGLKYAVLAEGSGEVAEAGRPVKVDYTGWLEDGEMFDSSFKRADPFTFVLGKGSVIKGWDEGIAGMKVGEKRQLVIPPELGYGKRRKGKIPPESTLVFDVELIDVGEPREVPEAPQEVSEHETTESGLKYHDFEVGTGASPSKGDVVEVDYTGWLADGGKMFDSSYARAEPIAFPIGTGRVIPGWDEGVMTMKVGGRRQLVIPADLAYGERGRPPVIPPSSDLVFEVHLVDVK